MDTKTKKKILSDASWYWRNFKTNFTRDLIMKHKDTFPDLLKYPPVSYAKYIEKTVWEEFVEKRLTPK